MSTEYERGLGANPEQLCTRPGGCKESAGAERSETVAPRLGDRAGNRLLKLGAVWNNRLRVRNAFKGWLKVPGRTRQHEQTIQSQTAGRLILGF